MENSSNKIQSSETPGTPLSGHISTGLLIRLLRYIWRTALIPLTKVITSLGENKDAEYIVLLTTRGLLVLFIVLMVVVAILNPTLASIPLRLFLVLFGFIAIMYLVIQIKRGRQEQLKRLRSEEENLLAIIADEVDKLLTKQSEET